MAPRIGFNGGQQPTARRSDDVGDGDVYARLDAQDEVLDELRTTVGRFPDPLHGTGGSGVCLYLYELRDERRTAKAAESGAAALWKTLTGRIAVVVTAFSLLGGAVIAGVKVAADLHWLPR